MITVINTINNPMHKQYKITFDSDDDTTQVIEHNLGLDTMDISVVLLNIQCYDGKVHISDITPITVTVNKVTGTGAGASIILTVKAILS